MMKGEEGTNRLRSLADISEDYMQDLLHAGIEPTERGRSGSFLLQDQSVIYSRTRYEGLELMSISDALKQHEWLNDYMWKVIPADMDQYTKDVMSCDTNGYFIRSKANAKVIVPVQACLFIASDKTEQKVHNIIIAEEDSELHIITGCSVARSITSALHLGVSEFYIKRGAKITFTMIHNWSGGVKVRPRSAVMIEDDGTLINNYILMTPVKSLQMYPTAYCTGKNAKASFQSIIYASDNARVDIGSRAVLIGERSRADITSRVVATDNGDVIARSEVIGEGSNSTGHIECHGLMLSDNAAITSIPELKATRKDIDLSHEAAIGRIAEDEILYLMARGLTEEEATSVIIRGFLNVDITGLPDALAQETKRMLNMSLEKLM